MTVAEPGSAEAAITDKDLEEAMAAVGAEAFKDFDMVRFQNRVAACKRQCVRYARWPRLTKGECVLSSSEEEEEEEEEGNGDGEVVARDEIADDISSCGVHAVLWAGNKGKLERGRGGASTVGALAGAAARAAGVAAAATGTSKVETNALVPPCQHCGAPRSFEFQVMPQLLYILGSNEAARGYRGELEWASLAVFTCTASCEASGYVEEYIFRQDEGKRRPFPK